MANGNFGGGNGTESYPYLIEDAFDLNAVRKNLNVSYKLINDINIKCLDEEWLPIDEFCGKTFDGNGHIIKNMNVTKGKGGLFSEINGSTIKNLGITDSKIEGYIYQAALLAGNIMNANIINCFAVGVVNTTDINAGGLIGAVDENCNIRNCYVMCDVIGKPPVGGFIGYMYRTSSNIMNCYCVGRVTSISGNDDNCGFISNRMGEHKSPIYSGIYFDKTVYQYCDTIADGKSTEEMKTAHTFTGWENEKTDDGKPVWVLEDGKYPVLWFKKDLRYLIKQNNQFYTLKSSFYNEKKLDARLIKLNDDEINNKSKLISKVNDINIKNLDDLVSYEIIKILI